MRLLSSGKTAAEVTSLLQKKMKLTIEQLSWILQHLHGSSLRRLDCRLLRRAQG